MNRIDRIFTDLRAGGRKALMPFVCGGYPTAESTRAILPALERAGASIVEIGIPFSDPIADGPVIAAAMHEALVRKVTPRDIFQAVAGARNSIKLGVVAMVSVSIVHRLGPAQFGKDAAAAGFDGVIIPDLPVEESARVLDPIRAAGLTTTLLLAPTTPPERMASIVKACTGFVYLLARVGITGTGGSVDASAISQRVATLRTMTSLPIACGFGISSSDHVRAVVGGPSGADAAIVGSALVSRMTEALKNNTDPIGAAEALVKSLAAGLS